MQDEIPAELEWKIVLGVWYVFTSVVKLHSRQELDRLTDAL